MTAGLFLVWGIMNKAAINTHLKKKKWALSLEIFHTHLLLYDQNPSLRSQPSIERKHQSAAHSLTEEEQNQSMSLILIRVSTERALLPAAGGLWKGSSHAWSWLSHGKERDQRSDWTSFWGKRPEINRKEQQYPGTKFLTDDDSIKNCQL